MSRAVLADHLPSDLLAEDLPDGLRVAAAEHLAGPLCVWAGDDGPAIRAATAAMSGDYRTITR